MEVALEHDKVDIVVVVLGVLAEDGNPLHWYEKYCLKAFEFEAGAQTQLDLVHD